MTAQWTAPLTWQDNDLVTAALLNTHLRDNLEYLKRSSAAHFLANLASNYSTTSTSFVDVDATAGNMAHTINTVGGDVLIGFTSGLVSNGGGSTYFDVYIDPDGSDPGGRFGGDDGLARQTDAYEYISFVIVKKGLAAGSHTFKLQWKVSASTGLIYAGAGAAGNDTHPTFWVRELP
ncbi:MAG: hypothetical protein JNJ61_11595 [Anaerolineae bacterium]|nr:hypothetical protein [Anaerolineae bacterium]